MYNVTYVGKRVHSAVLLHVYKPVCMSRFRCVISFCFTQEDYLHLVKKLTTRVCKSSKSKPSTADKWDITDSVRSEVRDLVNEVMSKCTTYTPESDIN